MELKLLYEDNHLIFVEKPVNIPVQEDNSKDLDLLNIVKNDLKERYNKPGNVYLGLVHRLDRPVGGVIVFAKTSKAASRISDTIRRQKIEKKYLAVIRGKPNREQDRLEDYLVKDNKRNMVSTTSANKKGAKKAILDYELIGTNKKENVSLVKVTLQTGRSHQIRVQFASRGMPLYGDQRYGSTVNKPGQQIALWSETLAFEHPVKKSEIRIHSNPPEEYPWNLWKID